MKLSTFTHKREEKKRVDPELFGQDVSSLKEKISADGTQRNRNSAKVGQN